MEMTMPKISVIIPVYNAEKYISSCIESIIKQTMDDIEIICINDGSNDNSSEVLSEYSRKDTRIRIITQMNKGRASARNVGIAYASAPYVMFCDADDSYHPEMCDKLYKEIVKIHADVATCEIEVVYYANHELKESDNNYYSLKFNTPSNDMCKIINNIDLSVCNKIFKLSLINKYNISFPDGYNYEDANFCWKYFSISKLCAFVNERLYKYNRHEDSIMNLTFHKNHVAIDHIIIANDIFEFLNFNNVFEKFKFEFAKFYIASFYFTKRYIDLYHLIKFYQLNNKFLKKYIQLYPKDYFKDITMTHQIGQLFKNLVNK